MDAHYFRDVLYPLQDRVLAVAQKQDTGFYLSGGTGASRGYLDHRYSEDLDLFVNDDERFPLWSDRLLSALSGVSGWGVRVDVREVRFLRLTVSTPDTGLKIELINAVPAHVGSVRDHPVLGRLDAAENILANKLTALVDRAEPKDLADVWGFATKLHLPPSRRGIPGGSSRNRRRAPARAFELSVAVGYSRERIGGVVVRGSTIWLTGLSGAGKSTIAALLAERLRERLPVEVLDGDELRTWLSAGLGFSKEDRNENIRRIAHLADLLNRHGVTAIVAAISPYREARDKARAMLPQFVEVYVRCPLDVCEARDPKGLYRKARKGIITGVTGIDDPYEDPLDPEVVCDTATRTPEDCVDAIVAIAVP